MFKKSENSNVPQGIVYDFSKEKKVIVLYTQCCKLNCTYIWSCVCVLEKNHIDTTVNDNDTRVFL